MNARLDIKLDVVDTFRAEFYLYAKTTGRRSGKTLKLDVGRGEVSAVNVLGALDVTVNSCDLHHADVTLSSQIEGLTWSRRVFLALGRKATLYLPDFLGEDNVAPTITAINDVTLDGSETATVSLTASDPNVTDALAFSSPDLPTFGTLTDNGDGTGSIFFDPAAGDAGTYIVTVEVTDSFVVTSTQFTVTVGANVATLQGDTNTVAGVPNRATSEASEDGDQKAAKDYSEEEARKVEEESKEANEEAREQREQEEDPDFNELTVSKLDSLLDKYELSEEGLKADKVQRLEEHYSGADEHQKSEIHDDYKEL